MKNPRSTYRISSLLIFFFLIALSIPLFGETLHLEYYGEMGCNHCDLFQEKILPAAVAEAERRVAAGAAGLKDAAGAGGLAGSVGPEGATATGSAMTEAGREDSVAPGLQVEAEYFDILSEAGFERCEKRLARMGLEFTVFPVLIIGNNAYQGNSAVEAGLVEELVWFAERGEYLPERGRAGGGDDGKGVLEARLGAESGRGIAVWPVLLAGLIDGVNPCAFATMLFFLTWISVRGGSMRRMVIAASAFIAGIFFAYLAIGYGLFSFLRAAGTMAGIRTVVRYLFAALAFLLALLSLRDGWLVHRSGKASAMVLKLPKVLKRRIHALIRRGGMGEMEPARDVSRVSRDSARGDSREVVRDGTRSGEKLAAEGFAGPAPGERDSGGSGGGSHSNNNTVSDASGGGSGDGTSRGGFAPPLLFLSLFVTGFLVSLLELACTGQIYFPTIAYMVQSGDGTTPLLWLLLYNSAFILPLLGVFILVLAGISRQRIAGWFDRHLVTGKVATALLFLFLGVMILLF